MTRRGSNGLTQFRSQVWIRQSHLYLRRNVNGFGLQFGTGQGLVG
jgi:hypothetical protein